MALSRCLKVTAGEKNTNLPFRDPLKVKVSRLWLFISPFTVGSCSRVWDLPTPSWQVGEGIIWIKYSHWILLFECWFAESFFCYQRESLTQSHGWQQQWKNVSFHLSFTRVHFKVTFLHVRHFERGENQGTLAILSGNQNHKVGLKVCSSAWNSVQSPAQFLMKLEH